MGYILFVDDDEEMLITNASYFKKNNYEVLTATNADDAMKHINEKKVTLAVLDVMMPKTDGFSLCKKIKAAVDIPVIFLTGKDSEDDKIKGLLLGADDYITKPYSLRELLVRVIVNLRKNEKSKTNAVDIIDFTPLMIDTKAHKVFYEEERIDLSNKEYELLLFLATRVNEPVSFEEIGIHMNGSYMAADRQGIMVNASRLRKKLINYPGMQNLIETVWSKGYKLVYRG